MGNIALHWIIIRTTTPKTASKSKVYVDFYRNWGRADEKHTRKTIVLDRRKDNEDIIRFEVKKTIK